MCVVTVFDEIELSKIKKKIAAICDPIFNKVITDQQKKENHSLFKWIKK